MTDCRSRAIRVERLTDQDAECHGCGKVGRPRRLIHFARLCQHFVALCGPCWRKTQREMTLFRGGGIQ